jgi:hypothetical protein
MFSFCQKLSLSSFFSVEEFNWQVKTSLNYFLHCIIFSLKFDPASVDGVLIPQILFLNGDCLAKSKTFFKILGY